ncbi:MAG: hypothetical protein GY869_12655, partial [Planctomycetes bacterium]|nr:hypothetical protein [Planctomycetota bacterium]
DSEIEDDEVFVFELQNVNGGDNAAVGSPSQFSLTIEDNDVGPATTVQFSDGSGDANEGDGTYNLTISITNHDAINPTSADVVLISGDGADLNNYTTQTVTFPAGNSTDQIVTITITDDSEIEGDETFVFELQNVNGGDNAVVGSPSQFNLVLQDNDSADGCTSDLLISEYIEGGSY